LVIIREADWSFARMKPSSHAAAARRAPAAKEPEGPPRRNVVAAIFASLIGLLITVFPLAAGALVFLDPVLKRKRQPEGDGAEGATRPFLRVASLSSVPDDGKPVQAPVVADLVDAWSREQNQPVGAVYLIREGDQVRCLNAICPHAGCFVGYSADRNLFQCPCHTSSFQLDGSRIHPSPSPRDMDPLPVDPERLKQGEVWVQFMNFYPGKEKPEVKG
jgi:menaquinol-cytochrome c reductase iron-sulfur subunit